MDPFFDLTIRPDTPYDAVAIERLAQLDSCDRPPGHLLLGEVRGELIAAISLRDGSFIADPFKPTAEAVRMLSVRRDQLVQALDRSLPARSRLPRLEGGRRRPVRAR
jgi:hypothetical protein